MSPPPKTIAGLLNAVYPSFALLAGMELDLFSVLVEGPLNAEQIAEALQVQAIKIRPLLYALVVAELLIVENHLFSNTPEASQFLVRGKPEYLGGVHELTSKNWARVLNTAVTIRNGGPLAELDYHSGTEELAAVFRGLYPGTVQDAEALMKLHDFSRFDTLLDVGGGAGGLSMTLAAANPNLQATVLELPSVAPITRQFVAENKAGSRVGVLEADAVKDPISGLYDVAVLRHLIQVLSEEDSRVLLQHIAGAVRPGGMIIVIGWILDDSRLTPKSIVGNNLILLNGYQDGQAYTEKEHFDWLRELGLVKMERITGPDGASFLTARKPAG